MFITLAAVELSWYMFFIIGISCSFRCTGVAMSSIISAILLQMFAAKTLEENLIHIYWSNILINYKCFHFDLPFLVPVFTHLDLPENLSAAYMAASTSTASWESSPLTTLWWAFFLSEMIEAMLPRVLQYTMKPSQYPYLNTVTKRIRFYF